MTNKFLKPLKNFKNDRGKILKFLIENPESIVSGEDFSNCYNGEPRIGYNANARLSELKSEGFVEICGKRKNKRNNRYKYEYKITEKGLNFKV